MAVSIFMVKKCVTSFFILAQESKQNSFCRNECCSAAEVRRKFSDGTTKCLLNSTESGSHAVGKLKCKENYPQLLAYHSNETFVSLQ